MEKSTIQPFLNSEKDLFLQLTNGFHYRCKIKELNDKSILIHDIMGEIHFIALDYIAFISEWKEKEGKK